jgi:hypothetical protein
VVDDEPLVGPEQLVRDDERADRVVARAASGVADHVRVALGQPGELRRIDPRVHAREDREATRGRHCELALVAEAGGVLLVGTKHLVADLAHDSSHRPVGPSAEYPL